MNTRRATFAKSERLSSTKIISGLFEEGNTFHTRLFKVVWNISRDVLPFPASMAISVSKKSFRLAVTRNLIKRRIREAYRKNKYLLYEFLTTEDKQVVFFIIFRGTSVPDYSAVEKSMEEMLGRLILNIREN